MSYKAEGVHFAWSCQSSNRNNLSASGIIEDRLHHPFDIATMSVSTKP